MTQVAHLQALLAQLEKEADAVIKAQFEALVAGDLNLYHTLHHVAVRQIRSINDVQMQIRETVISADAFQPMPYLRSNLTLHPFYICFN